jgi:UDP-glucose 4-epimerase
MLEHRNPAPIAPQRVVVIGAGGFVGGTIARRLARDGVPVLSVTRNEVDLLADAAGAALQSLLRPGDSVVFVSAIAPARDAGLLMRNLRMVEAAISALAAVPPAHLLYISSDAVYADDANPVTEESYCAPSTLHGMMHAARELMLRSAVPVPFAALRPTLIYGSGDPHGGYGPNRFRRQAEAGGPIQVFGEGEERRDHIDVADVAALASLMLQHRSVGALNAVTGVSTSFHDIAQTIGRHYGVAVQSQPRPGPRPHLLHRFFDITECLKAFPVFRFTALAEGLARLCGKPQE